MNIAKINCWATAAKNHSVLSWGRVVFRSLRFGAERIIHGVKSSVCERARYLKIRCKSAPNQRTLLLDQEIVALREELSVLNRLARAQDRKFEGSQGYALTRRLWLAEEELRLARSTVSTLGAEVTRSPASDPGIFAAFFPIATPPYPPVAPR